MIGIYKITNLIDGKCYIGQSVNIKKRFRSHRSNAKSNHNEYLRKSISKYGIDNFAFEVLKECKIEQLDDYEKKYILQFNSLVPNGYNMDKGGCVRKEIGEETIKKRRLASSGERNPNYGKPKSDSFKRIVAEARSKPINQYSISGKYLATYPNARSVPGFEQKYKNIGLCCTGKTNSAYGYQWRFSKDICQEDIPSIEGSRKKNNTPILQMSVEGKFIEIYSNAKEAGQKTGLKYKSIMACCKGTRNKTGGFLWRYADACD